MAGRGKVMNGFNHHSYSERDDFNSSDYNSYDSKPPALMRLNLRNDSNAKLHVANIPSGVDEKGLSNIFAAECSVPERVFISRNKKNPQTNTFWGFVEYKTVAEAQTAIAAVHKKPPYELIVQFSKYSQEGNKERDRISRDKSPQGKMGDRGRSQSIRDQSRNSFGTQHSNEEPWTGEELGEVNKSPRFSSHASGVEQNTSSRENLPGLPIEKYVHVEVNDEMDLHVAAYVSNRAKDLTLDDLSALCSEIKLALPFKPGQCCYCHRTAIYTCSRCKSWYCSDFCRSTHWPQHKDNCSPRSVIFEKDGALSYKDIPDDFCRENSIKQKNFGGKSPRGNQGKSFGSDNVNDSFENQNVHGLESNIDGNYEKFRDIGDNQTRSPDNRSVLDSSRSFNHGSRGGRNGNRRGGGERQGVERQGSDRYGGERQGGDRYGGERQGGDRYGGERQGGDRYGGERQGGDRYGGERQGGDRHGREKLRGERQAGGRFDKQYSASRTNESDFSNFSPHHHNAVQNKSQNYISNCDKAPIPTNRFTEVTVGAFGNEGEFWAYKVEDYKKQGTMLNELNECSTQSNSANVRVEMGVKCIAPYQGDWFRAEIIKTFRDSVRVIFIDFGNESEIKKSELKSLPEHLSSEPPMAHKYVLAESLNNPKLQDECTLSIKPIMQDKCGRWVVHAEGVQYHEPNGFGDV